MNIDLSKIIRESIDDLIYDDIISEAIDNVVLLAEGRGKGKNKQNRPNNNLANERKKNKRNNAPVGNTNANSNNEINQTAQQLFEKYNFKQYSDQLRRLIGNGIDPKPVADDKNAVQFVQQFNQFLFAVINAIESGNLLRNPSTGGNGKNGLQLSPYAKSKYDGFYNALHSLLTTGAETFDQAVGATDLTNAVFGGMGAAFNKGYHQMVNATNDFINNRAYLQSMANNNAAAAGGNAKQGLSLSDLMLPNGCQYIIMLGSYQNVNSSSNNKLNTIAVIPQAFQVLEQLREELYRFQQEAQQTAQKLAQQNGGNQGKEGQQGENDGKPRPDYSQYVQKINDGLNKLKGYEGNIRSLKSDLANTLSEAVADLSKNVITAINNGVYYTEDNKDGNTLPLTLLMSLDGKDDPTQNTYNAVAQIYINLKGEFENNPKSGNKVKTCFGGITSILANLRNQMTADKVTENGGASGGEPSGASSGEPVYGVKPANGEKPTIETGTSGEEHNVGTKLEIKPFGGYGSKEEEVEAKNNNYSTMVDETYNKFGMTPIDAFDVYGNQVFESKLSKKGEALKYDSQSMEDENASGELLGLGKSYEAMHRLAVEMTHKGQVADAGLKEQWGNSLNEIYENISNSYYDTENEKVENESKNMMGTYNYLRKLYADINDGVYSENTDPRRQVKDQITEKYQQTISEDYKYCEEILAEDKKFGFFKKHLSEDAIDIIDNLRDTLGYIKDALDTGVFNMMDSDLQSKTFNSPLQISSVLCLGRGKDDADKQWIEFWNSWQTAINWAKSKKDKEILESLENIYETLKELRNDLIANDLCDEWYKRY